MDESSLMEEVWKDIHNYEGVYQVSNFGKVKRLPTEIVNSNQFCSWVQKLDEYIFKPSLDSKGYPQVVLTIGSEKRTARVHRLVAEAYLEPPSAELKQQCLKTGIDYVPVGHKDNNPLNSLVTNLEWCTPKHNNDYCVNSGNHQSSKTKGVDNFNSILTDADVLEIIAVLSTNTVSQTELAQKYGVNQITISNIWTGRSWSWLTGKQKPKAKSRGKSSSIAEFKLKEN